MSWGEVEVIRSSSIIFIHYVHFFLCVYNLYSREKPSKNVQIKKSHSVSVNENDTRTKIISNVDEKVQAQAMAFIAPIADFALLRQHAVLYAAWFAQMWLFFLGGYLILRFTRAPL